MSKKRFLTAALILPILAVATAAIAGPNASDKRYWPSEARGESPLSAFAMERRGSGPVAGIGGKYQAPAQKPLTYQGGPKSGLTR